MVLHLQGISLSLKYLTPFGTVVSIVGLYALAMEHILWRQPWLHGWLVQRPNLRGTWRVTLRSDWVDPDTGQNTAPIICYMGVEQTLSTLKMHLMTPESESWLVAHSICSSPNNNSSYQVFGLYTNKPNVQIRCSKSNMHLGAMVIDTHGQLKSFPITLEAEYWTDRKTIGRMTITDRNSIIFTRFEDAQQAFQA